MIVIYTQDRTFIHNDEEAAKKDIISLYGEKLAMDAISVVKKGRIGTGYRKHGGPLIKVVSNEEAELIKQREVTIGMMEY